MDAKTWEWCKRLPVWLLIVLRETGEAGEAFMVAMLIPYLAGTMSLLMPIIVLSVVPQARIAWHVVIGIGAIVYLFVGVITYFSWRDGKNYGPWQECGPW